MTYVPSMYKRAARKATEPKPLLEADGKPLPRKLSDAIVLARQYCRHAAGRAPSVPAA